MRNFGWRRERRRKVRRRRPTELHERFAHARLTLAKVQHLEIRPATEADAQRCQRYVAELFDEQLPVLFRRDRPPTVEEQRAFIAQVGSSARSVAFLALESDRVIGILDFRAFQKPQQAHGGTFGMSVAKAVRGTGVGKELLKALFAWGRSNAVRRIELEVFSNNERAIQFYKRAGFVLEGRKREAVEVDGRLVDLLQMAKFL